MNFLCDGGLIWNEMDQLYSVIIPEVMTRFKMSLKIKDATIAANYTVDKYIFEQRISIQFFSHRFMLLGPPTSIVSSSLPRNQISRHKHSHNIHQITSMYRSSVNPEPNLSVNHPHEISPQKKRLIAHTITTIVNNSSALTSCGM